MAKYNLTFKKSVVKDLRRLAPKDNARILKCIKSLAENPRPHNCERLTDRALYRIREGVYRIIYEIHDSELVIVVIKVGHRREVYRGI